MRYRAPSNDDHERWRNAIKGYRQSIGLSVEGMAKALGIPAFRLDKIEKGVQPASADLEAKACSLWEDHMERDYEESRPFFDEFELERQEFLDE